MYFFIRLPASLSLFSCTLSAETLVLRIHAVEEVVPKLDKEPAVVRFVHQRLGMVAIMLQYISNAIREQSLQKNSTVTVFILEKNLQLVQAR